jgi:hypothetical protein
MLTARAVRRDVTAWTLTMLAYCASGCSMPIAFAVRFEEQFALQLGFGTAPSAEECCKQLAVLERVDLEARAFIAAANGLLRGTWPFQPAPAGGLALPPQTLTADGQGTRIAA